MKNEETMHCGEMVLGKNWLHANLQVYGFFHCCLKDDEFEYFVK